MRRNHGRRVHWLGFCNLPHVKHFRPTSIDSSSWKASVRFAEACFYTGAGQIKRFAKRAMRAPSPQILRAGQRIGLEKKDLLLLGQNQAWSALPARSLDVLAQGKLCALGAGHAVSALSYSLMAHECAMRLGTSYYLSLASQMDVELFFVARSFLKNKKVLS
jgi:hypothetical protein